MLFNLSLVFDSYHAFVRAITRSMCAQNEVLAVPKDYLTKQLSRVQAELALVPKSYPAFARTDMRTNPDIIRSQELSRGR